MNDNNMVIYQDDNGITKVSVRFSEDDLWLTQAQITELYQTSKSNISEHIKNILTDGELDENSVVRKFRTTASDLLKTEAVSVMKIRKQSKMI